MTKYVPHYSKTGELINEEPKVKTAGERKKMTTKCPCCGKYINSLNFIVDGFVVNNIDKEGKITKGNFQTESWMNTKEEWYCPQCGNELAVENQQDAINFLKTR